MAATVYRGRSLRARGFRSRHENAEENIPLDLNREPADLIKDILVAITRQNGITKARKLGNLNNLVKLYSRLNITNADKLSYTREETLCCVRLGLLHEAKEVRAACLRALRYMLKDRGMFDSILKLHIDYFIARSLDICLDNQIERVHAVRLIRKMVQTCPEKFPTSLVKVLVSIGNDGAHERDQTVRACLATITEIAVLNPKIVAECGGVSTILRSVLDSHQHSRINESLLAVALHLLNHPKTRHYIKPNVDLEQMLAPFTDSHYRYSGDSADHNTGDDREKRFAASKMAILTIIKSWPGMIRLCRPDASGLQSLLGALYLPKMKVRMGIMDILFDVFQLSIPEWTDNFTSALSSADPSEMRDTWRLVEGFVAEEGKALLPHTSKIRTNLVESHEAVILSAFISAGLLEALVEVITTSDINVSARATILLGELLHLANTLLPHECSQHSHCLPSLMALAASFEIPAQERQAASMAVSCLNRLHAMKKRGPVPCSLYLAQLMQHAKEDQLEESNRPLKISSEKLLQSLTKEPLDIINQSVRDSQVLNTKENFTWDWDIIGAILKWPDDVLRKLDEQTNLRFIKRVVYFFKPRNKLFSIVEQRCEEGKKYSSVGCQLMDYLIDCDENSEGYKLLIDWLKDIASCLALVRTPKAPPETLFSPQRLANTMCQDYFLFIGRLSHSTKGEKILEKTGLYQCLLDLVTVTTHDTYIKLVVSSLDYSRDGMPRIILSKAMTATSDNARLYTASFMRVLLRVRVPFFSTWGMELLVTQIYDQNRAIAMEALSVIDEACEDEVNLLALIKMRPSFLHLGEKGAMLIARFLSQPSGFKFLQDANYLNHELQKWHKTFNARYVKIVEEQINAALTTFEKGSDGSYTRRSSKRKVKKDVFVPIHLYGQLVQHKEGCKLLEQQEYISEYFECLKFQELRNEEDTHKLKTALWVLGHIGASAWGLKLLERENVIPEMIKLAEESGVYSIRGTAFYCLNLIASTRQGADILHEYGWESLRNNRQEMWPVIDEEETIPVEGFEDITSITSSASFGSGKSEEFERIYTSGARPKTPTTPGSGRADFGILMTVGEDSERSSPERSIKDGATDTGAMNGDVSESSGSGSREKAHSESYISKTVKIRTVTSQSASAVLDANEFRSSEQTKQNGLLSDSTSIEKSSLEIIHGRSYSDSHKESVVKSIEHSSIRRAMHKGRLGYSRSMKEKVIKMRSSSIGSEDKTSRSLEGSPFLKPRSASLRDERSFSNDSSQASKSRSDSFNTDNTTSGVESLDSGPKIGSGTMSLSPIASETSMIAKFQEEKNIHPSDLHRKMFNLKRTPSMHKRLGNPVILESKNKRPDSSVTFTSTRDAQGYLALKTLQRQRTYSSGDDSDAISVGGVSTVEPDFVVKSRSLDFRMLSHSRNTSYTSLKDYERFKEQSHVSSSPVSNLLKSPSKQSLTKPASSGAAEYIGLCLPVDISMIFQVSEGEDQRSYAFTNIEGWEDMDGQDLNTDCRPRSVSQVSQGVESMTDSREDSGLEYHTNDNCLSCSAVRKADIILTEINAGDQIQDDDASAIQSMTETSNTLSTMKEIIGVSPGMRKMKRGSLTDGSTPGSLASDTCSEPSGKRLSEDSETGRALIRKEVLKFIVNLSSSVGVKGSEQSLLTLKQKFPNVFHDVCLYSEVSYLLATYNFRLTARRFIQELFQDLKFEKLFEESRQILGIQEDFPVSGITPTSEVGETSHTTD